MHIEQIAQNEFVECDNMAFLLSNVNVFGKDTRRLKRDCGDSQIDIFREPAARLKKRLGASSDSWWWLRSVNDYYSFGRVTNDNSRNDNFADNEGGVVVGFCIETRSYHPEGFAM
jgi:hypothetical protein